MDAARWNQIDELLDAALEVSPELRADFVTARARNDDDLRKRVLELLKAQTDADDFLNSSAMQVAARGMAEEEAQTSTIGFIGQMIATYRVEQLLGAGGMGEVYLAFDTKLKRKVALKILPVEYLNNAERVKRFELEARAIACLNHPGIVTVYDVGNYHGVNYIATEVVEGKTLRDLIGGKFKFRNIVLNSIQICDALAAAHAAGIIHRDIKPENIMIRDDGYAKVMDFGLAKLTEPGKQPPRDQATTLDDTIIGTPAYMSPAQISHDDIDHRTDLWSAGVVLYEFLSGQHPFRGATRQETFQSILTKQPPPCSSLNPEVPPEMDHILYKLLEKDPAMRYQSASDLRSDLNRLKREVDSSPSSGRSQSRPPSASLFRMWPVVPAAIVLALISAGLWFYFSNRSTDAPAWNRGTSTQLTNNPGTEFFPSLAPDGKSFAYASDANDNFDIFVQTVAGKDSRNLTEATTANDTQPAFSPDGASIAFRSERSPSGIYVMGSMGENPKRVADFGFHPSWSPDGREIVVSTFGRDQPTVRASPGSGLWIIDVASGAKRELIRVEASLPAWSPNGHRIAYWYYTGTFGRRDIATVPAGGGEPVIVSRDFAVSNWNPVWSPDGRFLYFVSSKGGNLGFWRVAIDELTGVVSGEPEPVGMTSKYSRHPAFSRDEQRMIYVQTNNRSNIQGVRFDPRTLKVDGEPFWITEGDREIGRAELSPDGSTFLMRLIRPTQEDIGIVGRDGRNWLDVTNDEPFDRYARWSPNGEQVVFVSDRDGGHQVWIANRDSTGLRKLTESVDPDLATGFPVWSPDGTLVAVHHKNVTSLIDPNLNWHEQKPRTLGDPAGLWIVVWDWSPDGKKLLGVIGNGSKRHIGYYSLDSSEFKVVIENAGHVPSWLPDSRHFIYSIRGKVFIADSETSEVQELFENADVDIRSPFVSHDGDLLYYVAATAESDIWMIERAPDQ